MTDLTGDRVEGNTTPSRAAARAELAFRERIVSLGGEVLESSWLGAKALHRVRCREGHENQVKPTNVTSRKSKGFCRTCVGQDPAASAKAFWDLVERAGGTVLEDRWLGAAVRHRVRCAQGHETTPLPATVRVTGKFCRVCSGRDPGDAWARFRALVAERGGVVLEPAWLGNNKPHRVRCSAGHDCRPWPASVLAGRGFCRVCAGLDSATVERAFRERLAALGAVLLEPQWLGAANPHRVLCPAGHECAPRPSSLGRGGGICRTCAGNDPRVGEREFRERIEALGGRVLEPEWLGANTPHRVVCAQGHLSTPRPGNVRSRGRFCRVCAERDPVTAEREFRRRIAALGGTLLEEKWLGANEPHRALCVEGHECAPRPGHLRSGRGMCLTCARKDPVRAEAEFRARVLELGGEVLEPVWLGANEPHRVRCRRGHESTPRPTGVQQGQGICRFCMGKDWDAFYVVTDDAGGMVKFGITSGDPRPRLKRHESAGFPRVVRLLVGLPGSAAPGLERRVKVRLREAGLEAVRGTEYFRGDALPLVLELVDRFEADSARQPARVVIPEQLAFELEGLTSA